MYIYIYVYVYIYIYTCIYSYVLYIYIYIYSCDIHTHTPPQKSSTDFLLHPFVVRTCYTNWLGHGPGYEWHSSRVGLDCNISMVLTVQYTLVLLLILTLKLVILVSSAQCRRKTGHSAFEASTSLLSIIQCVSLFCLFLF